MASKQLPLGGLPNRRWSQSMFPPVRVVVFRKSPEGCTKVREPSGFEAAFSANDTAYDGRRQHIIVR